jgi:hypothetical protein
MSEGTITVRDRPDGGLEVKLVISDDRGKASNLAHSLVLLLAKVSSGALSEYAQRPNPTNGAEKA